MYLFCLFCLVSVSTELFVWYFVFYLLFSFELFGLLSNIRLVLFSLLSCSLFGYFLLEFYIFCILYYCFFSCLFLVFTRLLRALFVCFLALSHRFSCSWNLFVLTFPCTSKSLIIYCEINLLVIVCAFSFKFIASLLSFCTDLSGFFLNLSE